MAKAIELVEPGVQADVLSLLHLAMLHRAVVRCFISQIEQLLESEMIPTAAAKAALKNLDDAVDALVSDTEVGKTYLVTLDQLLCEMEDPRR